MFATPHHRAVLSSVDNPVSKDQPAEGAPGGKGVLVVDDDPTMLRLLQAVLLREGFTPWLAENGQVALELYEQHQAEIAVVLLDVRMPGLDGPQTMAALQRLNPDVACCFMSGHTAGYSREDLLARGALHFFEKPFALDEIGQVLRRIGTRRGKQTT
jgi:two-component system, OmpR family, response regulator